MRTAIVIAALLLVGWLISLPFERKRKQRLQRYWSRNCTGSQWRTQFPEVPKETIREFLDAFVDGFAFSSKRRLKFNPDDKVMDIYQAIYPPGSTMDMMELETFAMNLEEKYGFDLSKVDYDEITLGSLFEMTRNPNQAGEATS